MKIPKPNFIQRLQNKDDVTKRNIIVIVTIVLMVVIVYIWLAYF